MRAEGYKDSAQNQVMGLRSMKKKTVFNGIEESNSIDNEKLHH